MARGLQHLPRRRNSKIVLYAAFGCIGVAAWHLFTRTAGVRASGLASQLFVTGGVGHHDVERSSMQPDRAALFETEIQEPLPVADEGDPLTVRQETKARGLAKVMTMCLRQRPQVVTMAPGPGAGYRAVQGAAYTTEKLAEQALRTQPGMQTAQPRKSSARR